MRKKVLERQLQQALWECDRLRTEWYKLHDEHLDMMYLCDDLHSILMSVYQAHPEYEPEPLPDQVIRAMGKLRMRDFKGLHEVYDQDA